MDDSLIKSFDRYLSQIVSNDNASRCRLFRRGWKEFVDGGDGYENPVEVGIDALINLGIDDAECWCNDGHLMSAIVAFMNKHTGITPTTDQLYSLRNELDRVPVNLRTIEDWFCVVYAPT